MPATPKRAPRPEDLYRLRIPTDPRLSPDGSAVTFTLQRVGPSFDRYATAVWIAPTAGEEPARQPNAWLTHGVGAPGGRSPFSRYQPLTRVLGGSELLERASRLDATADTHLIHAARPGAARIVAAVM